MSIIIGLLNILLYAILLIIVVEICFWILSFFQIAPPPKIKQLVYMFCGVLVLIMLVSLLAGSAFLPPLIHTSGGPTIQNR
jgi:hypothetical protein